MAFKKFNEWEKIYEDNYLNIDNKKSGETLGIIPDKDLADTRERLSLALQKNLIDDITNKMVEDTGQSNPKHIKSAKKTIHDWISNFVEPSKLINFKEEIIDTKNYYKMSLTGSHSIEKILNHYSSYLKNKDANTLSADIIDSKLAGGRPAIGPGEFMLSMLTDAQFPSSEQRGDLRFSQGEKVEVKGNNGRLGVSKSSSLRLGMDWKSDIEGLMLKYNLENFKGESWYKEIESWKKGFTQKHVKAISDMYKSIPNKDSDNFLSELVQAMRPYTDTEILSPAVLSLAKSILSSGNVEEIQRFVLAFHFSKYMQIENAQGLLVFPYRTGDSKLPSINANIYITSEFTISSLYNSFKKNDVRIKGWIEDGIGSTNSPVGLVAIG